MKEVQVKSSDVLLPEELANAVDVFAMLRRWKDETALKAKSGTIELGKSSTVRKDHAKQPNFGKVNYE